MGLLSKVLGREEKENAALKWSAVVTAGVMILMNALANTLPINGQDTGEVSDRYANLFAPAGITFAIWSVIYALIIGYTVYQFKKVRAKRSIVSEATLNQVNKYFIASSLLNATWILAWHYEVLWLTVVLMLGILYCLIKINLALLHTSFSKLDTVLINAPFSIYFGWITVATVANIAAFLVSTGWDGFGLNNGTWMVAILLVTTVIGIMTALRLKNWLYGLVIVWAYAGILVKHLDDKGWNGQYPSVLATLYILLPLVIGVVLYIGLVTRRTTK